MKRVSLGLMALVMSSCGSGVEPLSLMLEDSITYTLSLPNVASVTPSAFGSNLGSCSSTNYCSQLSGLASGTTVTSPGHGFIDSIANDSTTGLQVATIYHNERLTSKVSMQTVSVRTGEKVQTGSALGTAPASGIILFQVLIDGVAGCPATFMDATSKLRFGTAGVASICATN